MDELRRLSALRSPEPISLPDQLQLQIEPLADCAGYDVLLGAAHDKVHF